MVLDLPADEVGREGGIIGKMTRAEARLLGLRRYFTGKPCKRGHVCERLTCNATCLRCHSSNDNNRQKRHRALYGTTDEFRALALAKRQQFITKNPNWYCSYRKKHPERIRLSRAKRRALVRGAKGGVSVEEICRIYFQQRGRCAYCAAPIASRNTKARRGYELDHIEPLKRGGRHVASNIQLTCRACNRRKSHHNPLDFARAIGRLL